jgi:hypothetical protein
MTDVSAKVENGKISIPLDVVKEKKIVRFEYEGNGLRSRFFPISLTEAHRHSGKRL